MNTLSFAATFRLTVWREVHARSGLFLILLGLLAIEAVLPLRGREPWEAFVLFLVLPPLAIALALRWPASTDSFWRGLGGHATARALATAVVHLAALLGTAALLDLGTPTSNLTGFFSDTFDGSEQLYIYFLCSLWALVFAGRAVAQGLVAVAPLLVGSAGLWGITHLAEHVYRWPTMTALPLRICLVGATALLCGLFLEGPVGAWGGAIRNRGLRLRSILLGLVLVLLGSLAVEAATPPSWRITGAVWSHVAPDGSVAYRRSDQYNGKWTPWTQRWTPEGGLEWWRRGEDEPFAENWYNAELGPKGARFFGEQVTWPDGTTTSCEGAWFTMGWSPTGRAVMLRTREQWGDRRILATPNGCKKMPPSVRWMTVRDGGKLVFIEANRLFIGASHEVAHHVAFPDDEEGEGIWASAGPNITLVGRRRGGEHTLWMLRGDSLVLLASNSTENTPDPRFFPRMQHTYDSYEPTDGCASSAGVLSCWDASGKRTVGPLTEAEQKGLVLLGRGWTWNLTENVLHRPVDGARVPLTGGSRKTGTEPEPFGQVVLPPEGGARYFAPGGRVWDVELPDQQPSAVPAPQ